MFLFHTSRIVNNIDIRILNLCSIIRQIANKSTLAVYLLLLLCIEMMSQSLHAAPNQPLEIQAIDLDSGWNLIAFQVIPSESDPASVFSSLGDSFIAAWTYDNELKSWSHYGNSAVGGADFDVGPIMGNVEIGRAYWIHMNSPKNWEIEGSPPSTVPPLDFSQGWNLVGIPTGTSEMPERVSMPSVLVASGAEYNTILKWEANRYKRFTPNNDDVDDFTDFDPNSGHWVNVTSSNFSLTPTLLSSVRADVDVSPQGNYPSFEDLQISESELPLGPDEQTHIVFFEGEDKQQLALSNTGGGILLWELEWAPSSASDAEWLRFNSKRGVTTIENDVINIFLDRTHLSEGTYEGVLTLKSTAGDREFHVVAHVPGLQGEWRGEATIENVNGKKNEVPNIDLHLDFFQDPASDVVLRGLIDSSNSLLWPVDVPLIGYLLDNTGNSFSLSGAYVLPPGDQNNPDYASFGDEDVDWNCNGSVDDTNPFPFPIYRSVELLGYLESGSSDRGYRISGSYAEVIYGMLRDPIRLEGSFTLSRQHYQPFTDRSSIENQESLDGTQAVVLKKDTISRLISPNEMIETTLHFVTDMALQGVKIGVGISADISPKDVKITLASPDGTAVVIHDQADIGSLSNMEFPTRRNTPESLNNFTEIQTHTKGEWKLIIENYGNESGHLNHWYLQLQGQPVFTISGQVKQPSNALVSLLGLPLSYSTTTNPDGTFQFRRIPGIPVNFAASAPGYEPATIDSPGLGSLFTTPQFENSCGNAELIGKTIRKFRPLPGIPVPPSSIDGFPDNLGTRDNPVELELKLNESLSTGIQIIASTTSGPAPLVVDFTVIDSQGLITTPSTVVWDFDDGEGPEQEGQLTANHVFKNPRENGESFTVTVHITAELSISQEILVLPSPNTSPYAFNFFQVSYTAGGSLPMDLHAQTVPTQPYLSVQHADCASFDIDRAPFTTEVDRIFDNDGLVSENNTVSQGIIKGEDTNYQTDLDACGYNVDDGNYDAYPRPAANASCQAPRYQMLCNLGPQIVPPAFSFVDIVTDTGPPDINRAPDPPPRSGVGGIAGFRNQKMITGPLNSFWKEGKKL